MNCFIRRVAGLVIVLSAVAAPGLLAQGGNLPTAYLGDDLPGLRAALEKDPDNLGLRMRIVRALLARVRETDRVQEGKVLFGEVEAEVNEIRRREPKFPYPYRVLGRLYYRRGEYEKLLALCEEQQKAAPLDQEMRSLYVKALLRLATRTEDPQPARRAQAAEFVGNWFDSGDAPSFGVTLGVCASWLSDEAFRDELLANFERRYEQDASNLNLVISYAAVLSALGRNESAWRIVQAAEKIGLCDQTTGARHPVAYILEMSCPETVGPESHDGVLLEGLEQMGQKFPKNTSFPLRSALILKRRADAATQLAAFCERRATEFAAKGESADADKLQKRSTDFKAEADRYFKQAVPFAEKALALNPKIDATLLLLGDLCYKTGRYDEAVTHFEAGLEMVPFFTDLYEGLARVHEARKDWNALAKSFVGALAAIPSDPESWVVDAPDSILAVPANSRDTYVRDLAQNPQARGALQKALEDALAADPGNPSLASHLAALHYFAGNREGAIKAALLAERAGLCGLDGLQFRLANMIMERQNW
ncbi:MAG: tetratricopeptide repeat protein [Planctomycetota bacterium]